MIFRLKQKGALVKKKIKSWLFKMPINNRPKIFCISFQRTGTTSTGQFFKDHGFKVATWNVSRNNEWTIKWFKGDYESILKSADFNKNQVFEDDPWWLFDFYKVLLNRFPSSKFILLERDSVKWFDSMVSHSKGLTLGNTHIHAIIYNREQEFYNLKEGLENRYTGNLDNLLPIGEDQREHYMQIYKNKNREVKAFFRIHDPSRLFNEQLEDKQLWQKMGEFFNVKVSSDYSVHSNKSK